MTQKTPTHQLCITFIANAIQVFQTSQQSSASWQSMSVQGEEAYTHHDDDKSLQTVLENISNNLNLKNQLADTEVTLIYAHDQRHLLKNCLSQLANVKNEYWQVLRWENLYAKACHLLNASTSSMPTVPETAWLIANVLPLLVTDHSITEDIAKQKAEAEQQHQKELTQLTSEKERLENQLKQDYSKTEQDLLVQLQQLEQEKHKLKQDCADLRQQNASLQKPELDKLLCFLPAIFLDFWNVVRPDELANLADRLDAPNIPSPYLQLSQAVVVQKKKEFAQLPEDSQQKILQFCETLTTSYSNLTVHQEFKRLF